MSQNTLGDRIRRAREDAGLNKAELARRIGVKHPNIGYWEHGQVATMRAENAVRLADACGVSLDWLLRDGPDLGRHGDGPLLDAKERRLLELFTRMTPTEQDALLTVLAGYGRSLPEQGRKSKLKQLNPVQYTPQDLLSSHRSE